MIQQPILNSDHFFLNSRPPFDKIKILNDKNKNSKSLKGRHVCCSMNFSIVEFSTRLRFDSDSEPPFSLIRIVDCMVWPS